MPDPNWPAYTTSPKEHYHALGVIAAEFNTLEQRLFHLSLYYLGFTDTMAFVFAKMRDNSLRVELLRRAVAADGETDSIKEATAHFCDGFDRCAQNRNILMHSWVGTTIENGVPTNSIFSKAQKDKPLNWNHYELDLGRLRQIADDAHTFARYGRAIFIHVAGTYLTEKPPRPMRFSGDTGPLPSKPPLPELLSLQPPPNPGI